MRRRPVAATGAVLATAALALTGSAAPAAGATGPTVAPISVTLVGHGEGHGRGMGQWGALGYAVDRGWSADRILDHYYAGTHRRRVGGSDVSVELTRSEGAPVTLTGRTLLVAGRRTGGYVRINRLGPGRFEVYRGTGCTGVFTPWFASRSVPVSSKGDPQRPADAVQICTADGTRGLRGSLSLFDGGGRMRVLNVLPLEDYLQGVVPRESPASWGDLGHGRGMAALQAQAVAARSYVLSSRGHWATTCDTTACQVYGGWFTISAGSTRLLEDPRSTTAVRSTRGVVRAWPGGGVARTEFSASSGGATAVGTFAPVPDAGDATSANPFHDWTTTLSWVEVSRRLGLGQITDITVSRRQYVGRTPTRASRVRVTLADGRRVVLTGPETRRRLGLHSDWFSFLEHRS